MVDLSALAVTEREEDAQRLAREEAGDPLTWPEDRLCELLYFG